MENNEVVDGMRQYSRYNPYGGILWQTTSSPPRAISITMWCSGRTEQGQPIMLCCCSCNPSVILERTDSTACEHLEVFLSGTAVCDALKSLIIDQFFSSRRLRYFGNCINQTSRFPLVKMVRT